MSDEADKVIVTNRTAMLAKYGATGAGKIAKALTGLVAADGARGITTKIVEIDSAADMGAVSGSKVISATDDRGAKLAVDAICKTYAPDYVLLLDGPDVIPHIKLSAIPGLTDQAGDGDGDIPSDLPYACDVKTFSRKISHYLAVTRVVGRLPMAKGDKDAKAFSGLIELAAKHAVADVSDYRDYFAMSADVWQQSTQLSLGNVFNCHAHLNISPDATHPNIDQLLERRAHFVNCHGANSDPRFYGEKDETFPIAMWSKHVATNIRKGTIAAVECCYGAELFDHAIAGTDRAICMSYLLNGAAAYVGSTNISYGPPTSNGAADLITQYFLEEVLRGASTGGAFLLARQRFIRGQKMADPVNLKTIAQFLLLGDPSLQIVKPTGESDAVPEAVADAADWQSRRELRRREFAKQGLAAATSASYPETKLEDANTPGVERVKALARDRGYRSEPKVFGVTGGSQHKAIAKNLDRQQKVVIIAEEKTDGASATAADSLATEKKLPSFRVLVAHMVGDGITAIEHYVSR